MKCPECNSEKLETIDSRGKSLEGVVFDYVRRRRFCKVCDHRFTTYELTELELEKIKGGEQRLREKLLSIAETQ